MKKIFDIGWHRTATKSMCEAMSILGFSAKHNPMDILKSDTLAESEALKLYDFLADFPIPIYFKEIDVAFPNSKFIFVKRDTESWLKSCKQLFQFREKNVWPKEVNKLHMKVYGTEFFIKEDMEKAYQSHNESVCEYFKDRENFLEFPLFEIPESQDKWKLLCEFVDRPIPDVPFPWSHKTNYSHLVFD